MLLAIDVGNTNISMGLFANDDLVGEWRLSTRQHTTKDEFGLRVQGLLETHRLEEVNVEDIVVSSVVPYLNRELKEGLTKFLGVEPFFLKPDSNGLISLDTEEPQQVGPDRIANCIAAREKYGGAALIVDFGTATSFDLLSEEGAFLGGAIAPEMEIALEALYNRAALLPEIELQIPDDVVGKTTEQSMDSGFVLGFIDLIQGLINRFKDSYSRDLIVIGTGGKGKIFAREIEEIQVYDEYMVLEGLKLWFQQELSEV